MEQPLLHRLRMPEVLAGMCGIKLDYLMGPGVDGEIFERICGIIYQTGEVLGKERFKGFRYDRTKLPKDIVEEIWMAVSKEFGKIIEEAIASNCDHSTDDGRRYINNRGQEEAEKLRESLFKAFQEKFGIFVQD